MKKRGIIAGVFVVLIAVAVVLTIVFVNLFTNKNTMAFAKSINSITQSGYLDENNKENKIVDEYFQTLLNVSKLSQQHETISNYAYAYQSFEIIGDFFNRQTVFTSYTDVFKTTRKSVLKNFEKAKNAVNSVAKYVQDNQDKVEGSEDWLSMTWNDCKANVESFFVNTTNAFVGLMDIYQSSVSSKVLNNKFSDLIFEEFKEMTGVKDTVERKFNGQEFFKFVDAYLSLEGERMILKFSYDTEFQMIVNDINEKGNNSVYFAKFIDGTLKEVV